MFAAAASLHCCCNVLSNGFDHVADTPNDTVLLSFCPVRTGLYYNIWPGLSGTSSLSASTLLYTGSIQ